MGGGQAPQPFQPPNQPAVANSLQQSAAGLQALGGTTTGTAVPGYQALYNNAQTNPYAAGAQASANTTGATGTAVGNSMVGAGQGLQNIAQSLGQYGPGIAATAFDPQHALYNQVAGQNQQQTAAGLAQSGLGGSPYAAGVMADSNQNFNLNWQNNEQQRQNAGVAALGQLDQNISSLTTAGANTSVAGLNALTEAGNLPTQTYQANQSNIGASLNQLVQGDVAAGQPYSSAAAADTSYLGIGQQASQTALQAFQVQQQADQAFWKGIGGLVGDAATIGLGF